MSNSLGLVDFAIGIVIFVLTGQNNVICPMGKCCFLGKFKLQKDYNQSCQSKRVLGLVEMTCGLVHASYGLHEWQSVTLTVCPVTLPVIHINNNNTNNYNSVHHWRHTKEVEGL